MTAIDAESLNNLVDRLFMLPEELKKLKQFLLWKYQKKEGAKKPSKIPFYSNGIIRHGIQGNPDDLSNLVTFQEAAAVLESGHYDGVGIAKLQGDGLVGLDLDGCIDEGRLKPELIPLIDGTYCERSPSGKGARAFYFGTYNDCKDHNLGIEVFCNKGFLTLTADLLAPHPIIAMPDSVKQLLDNIFNRTNRSNANRHHKIIKAFQDDPIYNQLKSRGLVRKEHGDGRIGITCPFDSEHTTGDGDSDCVYFPAHTHGFINGHFHCFHAHCENRDDQEFLTALKIEANIVGSSQPEEWEKPIPFDKLEATPINPDVVPEPLKGFCMAVSESIQVPFELSFMGALGAVSAAAQGKYSVFVKEDYSEPLNLYILGVLPPGERKSATMVKCKEPLNRWEIDQALKMEPEIRAAMSERSTRQKAIDSLRNQAGKQKDNLDGLIQEVKELENSLPDVPVIPRIFIDDATPEALAYFMSRYDNRAANLDAEGGIFEIISGLYSNAKMPNLNIWLKSWSGESVTVDRRTSDTIYVESPALTLCLMIQPEVLYDIGNKPGFRGRGLLGRFLYVLPESRLGKRCIETVPISCATEKRYSDMLLRLVEASWKVEENNRKVSNQITLSREARRHWIQFAEYIESKLGPDGPFAYMTDWAGKLQGQAIRLAGLYHVAQTPWPASVPIAQDTMDSALELALILAEHARIAFGKMGADPAIVCAQKLLKWITKEKVNHFSARDALNIVKGDHRFSKMEQVQAGLETLEERCFIRPMAINENKNQRGNNGKKTRGRKPSPKYEVNPLAHNSQNSQI